jgi:hypothetical protein
MPKEKIITVYEVPEYTEGDPYLRIPINADKAPHTMRIDRETGEYITLWEEKLRYPYCTRVASKIIVKTNMRKYTFVLKLSDGAFFWNNMNIPTALWSLLGMSKDSPYGLIASKWHDNLLMCKQEFLNEVREIVPGYTVSEFRRLTSLIFRQLLINNGVNRVKAYVMAWFVDTWQRVSPLWNGVK